MTPKALRTFTVRARLPEELAPLGELALNLRWAWDDRTRDLFRWVDWEAWEAAGADPYKLLGMVSRQRLEALARDPGFMEYLGEVYTDFRRYLLSERWFHQRKSPLTSVAYFSPEFGLSESFPQYSGGLGVLAGDHMKAASALGIPILGVGLFYRQGYFHQAIDADGYQQERYQTLDPEAMALTRVPGRVEVELADDTLLARIWKVDVGRAALYLLCTDVEENEPHLREVTDRLYSGDEEHRIQQEILIGMGGVKALEVIGEDPQVFHMNEGHAGFLALERIRRFVVRDGLSFSEAVEATRASTGFTTHTPVAAGIDKFSRGLMERYFTRWVEECGTSFNDLMALGQEPGAVADAPFNMAIMCLRLSGQANAVSRLHGQVSRAMFQGLWPGVPAQEVPIGSITNGVHARSWVSPGMAEVFDRYVLPEWSEADAERWSHIDSARDDELWRVKEHSREQLVVVARSRLRDSLADAGLVGKELEWTEEALDPRILTIGFARRFAAYKRPTLLFTQPERLKALLLSEKQPVQLVFAGKSHPADMGGKNMIREIIQFARDPEIRHRIVFLPDYDMAIARLLVQGADVWLNNPRRPYEACGTSGQKAALNGTLNLSVRDGWWDEMFDESSGWAIPSAETYETERRDHAEAEALFDVLERQVIPKFYDRPSGGVPHAWVAMMKSSLLSLGPRVTASRMLGDYFREMYEPLAGRTNVLHADGFRRARALASWKRRVIDNWGEVKIVNVETDGGSAELGNPLHVYAFVELGELHHSDVAVQLVHGPVESADDFSAIEVTPMSFTGNEGDAPPFQYHGSFVCDVAGRYGFSVRVVPVHEDLATFAELGCITWAG
ncbi:MAG: alpha-glucan family phosphorylase [Actinomycetota bacterium]|nr:alpha-glucan family phosphorylase [Actinomycetota bacterium]